MATYLTDAGGQVYLLQADDSGTPDALEVFGPTGVSSILLQDTVLATKWLLSIQTDGSFLITSSSGVALPNIPVVSPSGLLFGISVISGAVGTVSMSGLLCSIQSQGVVTATLARQYLSSFGRSSVHATLAAKGAMSCSIKAGVTLLGWIYLPSSITGRNSTPRNAIIRRFVNGRPNH